MEHPNLFRRSAAELRHPRCLALTALFISLNIAMDLLGIRIQLTPTIRIGPGFLCNACIGMLFGPFVAMLAGICTDTLGYLVNSGGAALFSRLYADGYAGRHSAWPVPLSGRPQPDPAACAGGAG